MTHKKGVHKIAPTDSSYWLWWGTVPNLGPPHSGKPGPGKFNTNMLMKSLALAAVTCHGLGILVKYIKNNLIVSVNSTKYARAPEKPGLSWVLVGVRDQLGPSQDSTRAPAPLKNDGCHFLCPWPWWDTGQINTSTRAEDCHISQSTKYDLLNCAILIRGATETLILCF